MSAQPTLRVGATGSSVVFLQQRLTAKGFTVKADGDFGAKTETAVEQFQAAHGLEADGIVGSITWALLMAEGQATTPTAVLDEAWAALAAAIPQDTPGSIRAVLEIAIRQLGKKEVPDGSNGGPELAHIVDEGGDGKPPSAYYQHWGITDAAILKDMPPWCAIFVSWALRDGLGAPDWKHIPLGNWLGGASQIEDWARKQGRWKTITSTTTPVPAGAIFTISREESGSDAAGSAKAGHVGLVVCDNGDGTVTTIEGNVGNKVGSHRRKKSAIRGFAGWW
jgi:hypothetical protein